MTEAAKFRGDDTPPKDKPHIRRTGERGKYVAARPLVNAVNTALLLGQPLLVTGEPGCGKTTLAWSIANELGLPEPKIFHTRSDSQAMDLFYRFDHLARLFDANRKDASALQPNEHYVIYEALGKAILSETQMVVVIDEIDKASRDFPNGILDELERHSFTVRETGVTHSPRKTPIVIITSNRESVLPSPFLRRCIYHHIETPQGDKLFEIVKSRLGELQIEEALILAALRRFETIRRMELEKKPATSELIAWIRVLAHNKVVAKDVPETEEGLETFLKTEADRKRVSPRLSTEG